MPPVRRQRGTFLGATLHFSTEFYKLPDGGEAVRKASKPPSTLNPTAGELWTANAAEFYRSAIAQGEIAKAGYAPHKAAGRKKVTFVVPILELAPPDENQARTQDSFSCHRPYLATNLKAQLETAWRPTHRELFEIFCGIVAGLHQIRLHAKRGHGNLKLSNVLLGSLTAGEETQAHLTDFRWQAIADLGAEERGDMQALARLLYELVVLGRPLKEEETLPPGAVKRSERWSDIDPEKGPLWCELCNRLKNTERRSLTLDELRFELEGLDPGEPVPWKRSRSLGATLAEGLAFVAAQARTRTALGGAAVLLLVALCLGAWKFGAFRGKEKVVALIQRNSEKATVPKQDGSPSNGSKAAKGPTPPTNAPSTTNATIGRTAAVVRTNTNAPVAPPPKASPGRLAIKVVPTNGIAQLGSNVIFTANAENFKPTKWEWHGPNNQPIRYATGPEFTITNVTIDNEGTYYVVANRGQSDETKSGTNLLGIRPTITISLATNDLVEGTELSATARVSPGDATSYQWLANGERIPNATQQQLNYKPEVSFQLSLRVRRHEIEAASGSFPIKVSKLIPVTPTPQILWPTNETSLDYVAGIQTDWTISYKDASNAYWIFNGTVFTNRFTPAPGTGNGVISAVALNGGKGTTNLVRIRRVDPPKIVGLTNSVLDLQGASTNLQVVASGTEPISYHWFDGGGKSPLPNASGSSHVATAVGIYRVVASNPWGQAQATFEVKVRQPPTKIAETSGKPSQFIETIEKEPVKGIYADLGYGKTITIPNASSESTWSLNGEKLTDIKGPSYAIKTVGITNAGEYSVKTSGPNEFKFWLWVQTSNQLGMEFVWVEMPKGGLWVGKHEVSAEQYSLLISNVPAKIGLARQLPAVGIRLPEIAKFCDFLQNHPLSLGSSKKPDLYFRVPRIDEFTSFAGSSSNIFERNIVFRSENKEIPMEPIKSRPPNRRGLVHVYGNVFEVVNNPLLPGLSYGKLGHGTWLNIGGAHDSASRYLKQEGQPGAGGGQPNAGFRVVYGHE